MQFNLNVEARKSKRRLGTLIKRAASPRNRRRIDRDAVNTAPKLVGTRGDGNCWGTTLWMLGRTDKLEYCPSHRMENFLDTETVEVSRVAFGDILVIRNRKSIYKGCEGCATGNSDLCEDSCSDFGLQHTAVYIGDGLYWHQRGMFGAWLIQTLEEITATYQGDFVTHRRKVS